VIIREEALVHRPSLVKVVQEPHHHQRRVAEVMLDAKIATTFAAFGLHWANVKATDSG
jgi:hypothetical protein